MYYVPLLLLSNCLTYPLIGPTVLTLRRLTLLEVLERHNELVDILCQPGPIKLAGYYSNSSLMA